MTNALIRTPESWARDWGWISHRRAKNMAAKLFDLADRIETYLGDGDEGGAIWSKEIRDIAKTLGKEAPAARRNRLDKAAELREPSFYIDQMPSGEWSVMQRGNFYVTGNIHDRDEAQAEADRRIAEEAEAMREP